MRQWLRKYIAAPEGIHHLRYCLPARAEKKTKPVPPHEKPPNENGRKMKVVLNDGAKGKGV